MKRHAWRKPKLLLPRRLHPPPPPPPPPVVQLPEPLDLYFDYDRYQLKLSDADKIALGEIAELLKTSAERVVAIEGHCDERGTSAYNLALGERRAKAAKQYLESQGALAAQIQTTSFGKERPVCTDHNKACWQKNRRAHVRVQ
ncbi:MAG: peptidoglycan-associated lipoprotein [Nitrospira sp.]|nr:peptidoglycan-associated lipoprotein [Nitrospira sp.]